MIVPTPLGVIGKIAGSLIEGCVKALLDPYTWILLAAAFLVGQIHGCEQEKKHFDDYKDTVAAAAEKQAEMAREKDRQNLKIQKEVNDASITYVAYLGEQLDAAELRMQRAEGRRFVPGPSASPAKPVPTSSCPNEGEREFLNRVYLGETFCSDVDSIDKGIRERVQRLRERVKGLVQPATIALDDQRWWGEWGDKVGACTPEPPK